MRRRELIAGFGDDPHFIGIAEFGAERVPRYDGFEVGDAGADGFRSH
ncbi:hypothetical protein [Bradyrhizobium sp. UFLA03-84]|nr:hypothetical protein [Bradyrhizobium sp. UFLA03-84]